MCGEESPSQGVGSNSPADSEQQAESEIALKSHGLTDAIGWILPVFHCSQDQLVAQFSVSTNTVMSSASSTSPAATPPRRPLKTRQRAWAQGLARILTRAGVAPNTISVVSLFFSVAAGVCLWSTARSEGISRQLLFLGAAASIQLRLLCNMLDGLVAIEGGRRTPYGEIFNDLPDRIADVVILVGAGYAISIFGWGRELGWLAGVLAAMTAYIRLLGGSLGLTQSFIGPMAKQHRMALLTFACVVSVFENFLGLQGQVIALALVLMVLGMIVTCIRRTARIVVELKRR